MILRYIENLNQHKHISDSEKVSDFYFASLNTICYRYQIYKKLASLLDIQQTYTRYTTNNEYSFII